jgi:uncharacterized protein (TIGR02145 family)
MKAKYFLTSIVFGCIIFESPGQNMMVLSFTAVNNNSYIHTDSIRIMNRSQACDTTLYWPDTVFLFYYVGLPEVLKEKITFQLFQNYPNPIKDYTNISLSLPVKDKITLAVTDITGRGIIEQIQVLDKGIHYFRFKPGNEMVYLFTVRTKTSSSSIKILSAGSGLGRMASLDYITSEVFNNQLKANESGHGFKFNPGDKLLFIAYANGLQSGILDDPGESMQYTFQFAANIPCPGIPTVEYGGHLYNTIQIFSQCWLKENLNVGVMITGSQNQADNGLIEKYCYDDDSTLCNIYGGLYQWGEMMQYNTQPGTQGICPPGWQIPGDEEWKVLEGAVDNLYKIGDPEWDKLFQRGFNAATNLKALNGWNAGGNGDDIFGFSALPGGFRNLNGWFGNIEGQGYWWNSTAFDPLFSWSRMMFHDYPDINRITHQKDYGYSVRCIKDN